MGEVCHVLEYVAAVGKEENFIKPCVRALHLSSYGARVRALRHIVEYDSH